MVEPTRASCIKNRAKKIAFSYKMKLEAIKRQDERTDLTSTQMLKSTKEDKSPDNFVLLFA